MAEIKVSQLPEATQINDEDLLMIVQGNTNKKITKANAKFASGDEIFVGDTLPSGEDADSIKFWLTDDDALEGEGNYISNEYSVATNKGYSCNYVNNSNTYSTSEVKTDMTWIDGKPIYRKVLSFSTSATINAWDNKQHGITNMDKPMPTCKMAVMYNGSWYICPNDLVIEIHVNSVNLSYYNNSTALANQPAYAVIEYTKTS